MTNLCSVIGTFSPIWSTLRGFPAPYFSMVSVEALLELFHSSTFSLCPLSTPWSTRYMLISISESDSQKTQFMAAFFFFFCKIYIGTKQNNELSLKSIFYFIHENLVKLSLFLLYNFSVASWKIRNYWTCVSYVFLTLWSKTVREKSSA